MISDDAQGLSQRAASQGSSAGPWTGPWTGLRVGLDLVEVARVQESLDRFGERYTRRVFTAAEIAYCESSPAERTRRYAARYAAKEATWKALALDDAGQAWTSIELVRDGHGCTIRLHAPLAERASARGAVPLSVSITHEAGYAAAVVLAHAAQG